MFDAISKKVLKTDDRIKICLWFPKLILKTVYMWPDQNNIALQRLIFLIILVDCTFIEYGLYNFIAENFKDFNESFRAITFFSTTMQVIVKGIVFYYYINKTKSILDVVMYKFWPSNLVGNKTESSLTKYYNVLLTTMMSIYYFNGAFFSIAFIVTPLLKEEKETPYKTVYPFDYGESPKFEIMYVVQSFTNFYIVLGVIIGVDTIFMAICSNITAQYRLLKKMFMKFGTNEVKEWNIRLNSLYVGYKPMEKNMSEERKFLVHCISHHQLLLRTVADVEKVFNIIGFFQLGFSIVAICLSSFVLTRENVELNQLVNIVIFISGHVVQLFLYCSVANELDFEMNTLSQCIFSSEWYQTNFAELKQDIVFVLKKSQKMRKLTALKIFPLNYNTFIHVLRISFSFHTLLSSIANK